MKLSIVHNEISFSQIPSPQTQWVSDRTVREMGKLPSKEEKKADANDDN